MGKLGQCPGCKRQILNGRAYSVHLIYCKVLPSATDSALNKHKILAAKKSEVKRLEVAVQKGLRAHGIMDQAASGSHDLLDSDNQHIDTDIKVPPVRNSPSPPPRPSGRPNR